MNQVVDQTQPYTEPQYGSVNFDQATVDPSTSALARSRAHGLGEHILFAPERKVPDNVGRAGLFARTIP